jgi:hypothetical protein
MTQEVAQRLVHELPGWDRSVEPARAVLGYDPRWWTTEAIGWDGAPPEPPLAAWFASNRRAFRAALGEARASLGLWDRFAAHWRACFLSRQGDCRP